MTWMIIDQRSTSTLGSYLSMSQALWSVGRYPIEKRAVSPGFGQMQKSRCYLTLDPGNKTSILVHYQNLPLYSVNEVRRPFRVFQRCCPHCP
ncbi:hypothetical protein K443DRAFT_333075 [Laccaria amethystina LaAM-08-1]|uniref:Uncharacterized protein n=1 Tax=Laccaria amethystina LaAM-08-1 TaxID=1095629 RepID=A0A0C9WTD4_9AGAR|nr:hypothetical protein K443DRAFT_333075 [Laccaria amethystina LaAM-08-1]